MGRPFGGAGEKEYRNRGLQVYQIIVKIGGFLFVIQHDNEWLVAFFSHNRNQYRQRRANKPLKVNFFTRCIHALKQQLNSLLLANPITKALQLQNLSILSKDNFLELITGFYLQLTAFGALNNYKTCQE